MESFSSAVRRTKVLFVDDDDFIRELYKPSLEKAGFDVVTAADGESGLRAAETEKPDLIILDLIMPIMNGYEVLARLLKNDVTKAIPVIILTGMGQKEDLERVMKSGAKAYLLKPQTLPTQVPAKVREVLGLPPVDDFH